MYLDYKKNKGLRLLSMYERLNRGELLHKEELAVLYHVTPKTIQRDIDDLRIYLTESHMYEPEITISYDRKKNGYFLVRNERECFTNEEVITMGKMLLETRGLCKPELEQILTKLVLQLPINDRKRVEELLRSERFHYIPPRHNKTLFSSIWELSESISHTEIIEISYIRKDGVCRKHQIKPVSIMFSEYYFYLIAFMADGTKYFPTVFRIDRINQFESTKETFYVPYKDKFSDGEFRKRVQFMFSGELRTVTFLYKGLSIESVLDRLPTAEILLEKQGQFLVRVEVYGNGIDMWLRSQGELVEVVSS